MDAAFFHIKWLIFIRRNGALEKEDVNKFCVIHLYAYSRVGISGPLPKLSDYLLGTKATLSPNNECTCR